MHEDSNYFYELRKGAEREREERRQQTEKYLNSLSERANKRKAESLDLASKVYQLEQKDKQRLKEQEIERETKRVKAKLEAEWDAKGIDSDKTVKLNNGYKQLLDGITNQGD